MSGEPREPDALRPAVAGGTDMTVGSVVRHLVLFSFPMLLGNALHTAYSIINAIWVGNGLGTDAMAAITVSFPIFFVLMAVAGGLTLASNILVSQSYGAKDWPRLRQVVQNSLFLTAIVSFACVAIGYFSAASLLRIMQTPPEVLPIAISYLRLFVWTLPFMFGIFFLASVMRGAGDSKTPLYFQAGSLVMTAILDPLLMFGWLGFPRLGLNGTAVATIASQAAAFISLAVHLHRRRHIVSPDWRRLSLDLPTTLLTLRIGIPSMVQQALVSLGMLVIMGMVNQFGAHCTAAYGIAMRVDQIAFMPTMAIGAAVSTLAGQNIGAKRIERVREVFVWGMIVSCSITSIATILALGIPAWLMRLFTQDPDVIATGAHYLRIVGFGYLMLSVMWVSNGVINGSGHTMVTTLFTLIGFWVIRIPLAAYLSSHIHRVDVIWYATLISFATGTVISLMYYASGRWKRPIKRLPSQLASSPASTSE